jgi:hypothetical protein
MTNKQVTSHTPFYITYTSVLASTSFFLWACSVCYITGAALNLPLFLYYKQVSTRLFPLITGIGANFLILSIVF